MPMKKGKKKKVVDESVGDLEDPVVVCSSDEDEDVSFEKDQEETAEEEVEKKPAVVNPDLIEITEASDDIECMFCKRSDIDEPQYGKMYKLHAITAHYFCVLFSSGMEQNGLADHEGMWRFLEDDIKREHRRGKKLKCKYCKKPNASVGCIVASCRNSFHFTCGSDNGTLHQCLENFKSFCARHKSGVDAMKEHMRVLPKGPWGDCPVCADTLDDGRPVLSPPCCPEDSRKVYHKYCLQKHACTAGSYQIKCPNQECKDKFVYMEYVRRLGVYIPIKDAAWEKDEAYEKMKELEYKCCVKCLCENGTEFQGVPYNKWKIVRCGACGAAGTHMFCSGLTMQSWKCPGCLPILRTSHTPITYHDKEDESGSEEENEDGDSDRSFSSNGFSDDEISQVHLDDAESGRALVVHDSLLKKTYKVQLGQNDVIDSDSDSDDEIVEPETLVVKLKDNVGPPVALPENSSDAAQITSVAPACDASTDKTSASTSTEATEIPPETIVDSASTENIQQSNDASPHSEAPTSSCPVSVPEDIPADDSIINFDDGWSEIAVDGIIQLTSASSQNSSPPQQVPHKSQKNSPLATPTKRGTSEPSLNVSIDEQRPGCSRTLQLQNQRAKALTPASSKTVVDYVDLDDYPDIPIKKRRKKVFPEPDDDICIVKDTRAQRFKHVKKPIAQLVCLDDSD